ncbi:ATP-dependent DNA helicase RecG [Lactobacillus crispatus]|uniref:ATP-dependent DNA helicase RecG n=1 Tax=Lactobacillus crispatus TaxID=47770 RepID=A0A4Q0LYS9_9LACO|nr:ATP-dependent DNA helicase RecG [Lactobacillus crispatus]MBG0731890.1 ATP-dependent DNA helicase RecG [Lactobacillus crispatus]MBI1712578.1 ATP-dependent DNA helicase RecG [Lactobacillus crispatus]MCZ3862728.1 ATP-dependent DNA helicase RecG [Lactobacillus crispatus]MCZ3918613.1 ATP-dependent DNA helicase RecG [Lactobacillus crispatus]MCZ3920785.1 ATP-dependent DNA helicase RecG [Lactobacillus crispatus]
MIDNALFAPVTDLKGVGTKTTAALGSLGIYSIYDLLFYFPFRYDELQTLPLDQIMDGQKVMLKGIVATEAFVSRFGYKKTRLSFKMRIDHDVIMVNFFNQPWLKNKIEIGQEVAIYGKYNVARQSLTAFKFVAAKENDSGMAPIYPVNRHVKQKKVVDLINVAIDDFIDQVQDIVPEKLRQEYRLLKDQVIIEKMHHPKNSHEAELAKRSAIFREFFIFELQLALLTRNDGKQMGYAKKYDLTEIAQLTKSLPFELSDDQKHVVNEIFADMHSDGQMRRLLQGDVGSGKTVVAVYAIFAAITAGYQAALMVPTEILATQHFKKIDVLLRPLGVRVALLTGNTKTLERREIYRELTDGTINVVIGTHALIQDSVIFKKLGLVIIDEQHRFGVGQRQALINKGDQPDILAMTATPIPRTLALTVYGDMTVSEIHHLPAGRKPIISTWKTSSQMKEVYRQMQEQLNQGFQIYAVTPLITESETLDLKNAEELHEKLSHDFPDQKVVLLHGQMPGAQKDEIMAAFAAGEINILVTTSVIEVGVDVANANMMVIYNADRFGLSQLHQLRGRIGRGQTQSYCVFLADPKTDSGKARMKIIASTNDGFKLAEEDLKMRGEGDLFGKAQSGLPEFRVGDVVNNYNTLVVAQKEARALVAADPDLSDPGHKALKQVLEYKQLEQNRI